MARSPGSTSRALASVLALTLLAGACSESAEEKRQAFCDDAGDLGQIVDPLRDVSAASTPEELQALFEDNLERFRTLAEDAPDDIVDDFESLVEGIEANEDLLAGAQWDMAAVDQAALADLQQEYRGSSDTVNAWLQRCQIDTGGGPATTAPSSSTTG